MFRRRFGLSGDDEAAIMNANLDKPLGQPYEIDERTARVHSAKESRGFRNLRCRVLQESSPAARLPSLLTPTPTFLAGSEGGVTVPDGGSAPRATGSLRAFRLGRARQLPSSVRSTSSRNVSKGKGVMSIRIFYHLFLVNEWRRVFEFHLKQMRRSGLYDACEQVHVGAVYDDARALSELNSLLPGDGKTTLRFRESPGRPRRPSGATPRSAWPTAGSENAKPYSA